MVSTDWHVSFHSLKRGDNSGAEWIFEKMMFNRIQVCYRTLRSLGFSATCDPADGPTSLCLMRTSMYPDTGPGYVGPMLGTTTRASICINQRAKINGTSPRTCNNVWIYTLKISTWIPKSGSLEMELIMEFHGLSFQINVFWCVLGIYAWNFQVLLEHFLMKVDGHFALHLVDELFWLWKKVVTGS